MSARFFAFNTLSKRHSRPALISTNRCNLHSSRVLCLKSWGDNSNNHYEILGVERNASTKEIRNAFLELSKSCHPDTGSQDSENHNKFVQINEAYTVLSKPLSRKDYDQSLLVRRSGRFSQPSYSSDGAAAPRDDNYDSQFYAYRDRSQDEFYSKKPYYGVSGIAKLSNRIIVYTCLGIILVGSIVHSVVVKTLSDNTIEHLNERDKKNHKIWMNANDPTYISEQVQLMKIKIEEMEAKRKGDE